MAVLIIILLVICAIFNVVLLRMINTEIKRLDCRIDDTQKSMSEFFMTFREHISKYHR